MTAPDVTILIVSFNTCDLLEQCLNSVYRTCRPEQVEVIVVDNASTDGSVAMVEDQFPQVKVLVNDSNKGFASANNRGLEYASGRYFLLLNSDAFLQENTVTRLLAYMDKHPRVGIVGGQLFNPDGSFQSSYADFPSWWNEVLVLTGLSKWFLRPEFPSYGPDNTSNPRHVDWMGGALLLARRQAVMEIGGLDEDYFMYAEEMDWCYRMKAAGWTVAYLPDAWAIHVAGGSSKRIPERKRAQLYRSKWLFMIKHHGPASARTYRFLVRAVSTLKMIIWLTAGATKIHRSHAREQVASYRFLLAEF